MSWKITVNIQSYVGNKEIFHYQSVEYLYVKHGALNSGGTQSQICMIS